MREIEVKRDNEILGDKIINIFSLSNKKKMKPLFEFKKAKTKNSQSNKYFVNRVEQDNQQMLKRLIDLPSNYDKKIWYKDYEKSQGYKKNICIFPSINFLNEENERNLHSSQNKRSNLDSKNNNNNINNLNAQNINNYNFSKTNGFYSNKKRSSTSYSKFKNTEKLYGSKYFQNTEDSSKEYYFFLLFLIKFIFSIRKYRDEIN